MNKRKLIYFLSAFVLIIGCYALNLSYSLFTQNITSKNNVVDTSIPLLSARLETNTYTIPANNGEVVTLKILNSGTANIQYGISINELPEGINAYLVEKEDNDIVGKVEASQSKEVLVYLENTTENESTITFNLDAKYETVSFDKTTFITNSNIDCVNKIKLLNESILARAKDTTITDEEKTVYSTTFLTIPAKVPSAENERLLLETEDDYTETTGQNSYYFRGNIKDNYVNFANMCWRIIRIEGDGSVKLILEDQDQLCDSKDNSGNLNMDGNWYIPISNEEGADNTGNFGYTNLNNYRWFINYLNTDGKATNYESSMATVFKNFQTSKLINFLDNLNSGGWCLNDTAYASESANVITDIPLTESEKSTFRNNFQFYYYDSAIRLFENNTKQLTLKCNGTKINNFVDNTEMYVGTVTVDEIVFAGAAAVKYGQSANSYYLSNQYQMEKSLNWWSFSPDYYEGDTDRVFVVGPSGSLESYYVLNEIRSFRPSISLISSVVVTDGIGTMEEPYIIG